MAENPQMRKAVVTACWLTTAICILGFLIVVCGEWMSGPREELLPSWMWWVEGLWVCVSLVLAIPLSYIALPYEELRLSRSLFSAPRFSVWVCYVSLLAITVPIIGGYAAALFYLIFGPWGFQPGQRRTSRALYCLRVGIIILLTVGIPVLVKGLLLRYHKLVAEIVSVHAGQSHGCRPEDIEVLQSFLGRSAAGEDGSQQGD